MANEKFNPAEHLINLKGKDYLQVMWRLVWFREEHPDFGLETTAVSITEDHAIFKCVITDENGVQKCAGHGSEGKRDFGDFIEKAETKAVGRALAMMGYGTQFVADEFDEAERIVDSPVNRAKSDSAKSENGLITGMQMKRMKNLCNDDEIQKLCDKYGLKHLGEMSYKDAESVIAKLEKRSSEVANCEDCNGPINADVVKYSMQHYGGRKLCRNCQKNHLGEYVK